MHVESERLERMERNYDESVSVKGASKRRGALDAFFFFFFFFMAKQREASERERERELFPPSHFFPAPFVFPFLHAPARSHGSSSGQQQQGDLPFRLERQYTHRRRIAAAAAAAAPRSRRHGRR